MGKESAKVGQGKAFKEGWIKKDKDLLRAAVRPAILLPSWAWADASPQTDDIQDASREQLQIIQRTRTHPDPKVLQDLRKRKLITMQKVITFEIKKGPNYAAEFVKEETDLTADMLATYVERATTNNTC